MFFEMNKSIILAGIAIGLLPFSANAIPYAPLPGDPENHHSVFFDSFLDEFPEVEGVFREGSGFTANQCSLDEHPGVESKKMYWDLPMHRIVNKIVERFSEQYPKYVRVKQVGESVQGRIIYAVRLGTSDYLADANKTPKPVVVLDGSTHGNEYAGTRILLDWMDYVLNPLNASVVAIPGRITKISDLLNNYIVWIVPIINPDAYEAGGFDGKGEPTRNNYNNKNIARDYPYGWVTTVDLDNDGNPTENPKTYPMSQPETRTAIGFYNDIGPEVYLNIHGYRDGILGLKDNAGFDGFNSEMRNNGGNTYWNSRTGKPIANERYNWVVWAEKYPDTDTVPTVSTFNNDVMQYIRRDYPNNLPELAETGQTNNYFHGVRRSYAPYANTFADYGTTSLPLRGVEKGRSGSAYGAVGASLGALSFLYEVPQFNPGTTSASGVTSFTSADEVFCVKDTDRPFNNYLWLGIHDDVEIQELVRDSFYPINRLITVSANPLSQSVAKTTAGGAVARYDLAVTGLYAKNSVCTTNLKDNMLETYWPVGGQNGLPSDLRNGYYGVSFKDVVCTVKNHGNKTSSAYTVTVNITDTTNGTTKTCSKNYTTGLAALAVTMLKVGTVCPTITSSTEQGKAYSVSCEVTSATSDNTQDKILQSGDPGCKRFAEYGIKMPYCSDPSTGIFDATFNTSSKRTISFAAKLNAERIYGFKCGTLGAGVEMNRNINGYFVGHIPAIAGNL